MASGYARNAIVLGLLSAIGPFAIDMYLPALPTIATDLGASTAATQMTLMAFFIGFGLAQIVYGPLSDMVGRKPPLYFGLGLFVVGAVGCYFAPNVETLVAFRLLQGIGAAAANVIPRAIIRDLHTGTEATRLMSLVMLVFSVSPILAPLAGSALIVPFGWRVVFVAVSVAGLLAALMLAFLLPETRKQSAAPRGGFRMVLASYAQLLRNARFLGLTFIGGLGMAAFFAFLASSSFVYIDHYGLTPTAYSIAFSVNAVGFIGASQFSASLGERFGIGRVVLTAASGFAAFALTLLVLTLAGVDSLPVLIGLLILAFACLGLVVPATMVLALEEHGPIAGMAAALGGTLQMVTGGLMIVVTSVFFNGTSLPMVATIAVCAVGSFVLARLTLGRPAMAHQPAE